MGMNLRLARLLCWALLAVLLVTAGACGESPSPDDESALMTAVAENGGGEEATGETVSDTDAITNGAAPETADPGVAETLPALEPVTLGEGERLRVVATTSLVADVARRVGGDAIELTTLIPLGVDPHSYTPTPQDLRTLNDAHVILMNGLGLEEALMPLLTELETPVPVVSVNAGLAPLTYGEGSEAQGATSGEDAEARAEAEEHLVDPHTWLSVSNVELWVDNTVAVLTMLDTAKANDYFSNAGSYLEELDALDSELRGVIETLPAEKRKLISDHLEFNYFAQDYGFETIGAVISGVSTMVSPSAQELAALQEAIQAAGVDAIFVGENVDDRVVNQLANDLGLEVVKLYTSSLSDVDGPAPDYPSLMRHDVGAIVSALAE